MTYYENIVILIGAGISAESGLDTFRDKGVKSLTVGDHVIPLYTPECRE